MYSADGECEYYCAENFEKLLFQCAFIRYEELYFKETVSFGGSLNMMRKALAYHQTENIFEIVDKFAQENSFTKAWFSDRQHYCGISDTITFYVNLEEDGAALMSMSGRNFNELKKLGKRILKLNIGVSPD
ncbi:MAG: hypothetical protein PVI90_13910 [Desulfobacteraceae bacterium]